MNGVIGVAVALVHGKGWRWRYWQEPGPGLRDVGHAAAVHAGRGKG